MTVILSEAKEPLRGVSAARWVRVLSEGVLRFVQDDSRTLILVTALLATLACDPQQRGCASRAREAARDPMLAEVDCPGSMARCTEGVVDVSIHGHRPAHCAERPEACVCPRRTLGPCDSAHGAAPRCVRDGVEVAVTTDDDALTRLCLPATGVLRATGTPLANVPSAASDVSCERSEVRAGDAVVARCARGCAVDGDALPSTNLETRTLVQLLCAP